MEKKKEENENPSTPSKKIAVSTKNKLTTEGKSEVSKFAKSAPKISKFGNIKSFFENLQTTELGTAQPRTTDLP